MTYANVNLHDNFHLHANRASSIPVNALRSFWRSPVEWVFSWPFNNCLCLSVFGAHLLAHFHCFANAPHMGSLISKIREVLQDAPKASKHRKSELFPFCTGRQNGPLRLSVPPQSLSSKEALPVLTHVPSQSSAV